MTSRLLVYIVLELGFGGCSALCKTAAEGLSSIFLKKKHLDRVVGFRDTTVRQLAEFGPFILGQTATRTGRGLEARPMTWGALGAHGSWATEGQTVPAVPGSSFSLWGPQWRSSICLLLSAAILQFHILTRIQRGSLCSLVFHCGKKIPRTWKREDLF